jgi:hypothetical protein
LVTVLDQVRLLTFSGSSSGRCLRVVALRDCGHRRFAQLPRGQGYRMSNPVPAFPQTPNPERISDADPVETNRSGTPPEHRADPAGNFPPADPDSEREDSDSALQG